MALIYAFRDEAGQWHGDPAGIWHDVDSPAEAPLTFPPGCASPFAGQTLLVRVGGIVEATPGSIRYFLDDGTTCHATRRAETQLFGPDVTAARRHERWPPPGPAVPPPPDAAAPLADAATPPAPDAALPAPPDTAAPLAAGPSHWEITDGDHHYDLTTIPGPEGLTVEILGADRDGQVIAHLAGRLPEGDLAPAGRLLQFAAEARLQRATASRRAGSDRAGPATRARRRGGWTKEEKALAVRRHHEGAEVEAIAAELGRSPTSVGYKLHYLGLAPLPFPGRRRRLA